jgi:hypothetical protein
VLPALDGLAGRRLARLGVGPGAPLEVRSASARRASSGCAARARRIDGAQFRRGRALVVTALGVGAGAGRLGGVGAGAGAAAGSAGVRLYSDSLRFLLLSRLISLIHFILCIGGSILQARTADWTLRTGY